ncbi:MAG TPA: hypothetical protein VMC84_04405 [Methanocella sp.]|uniref:hypothetical protein n=1 Tax=Methanocella sp. TaxID=2052833 RepID=UPI002B8AA9F2|nr:hypothetical protein [Methanocella sp.]HTY90398.1 hypothetical protein [Methanocella sp.]
MKKFGLALVALLIIGIMVIVFMVSQQGGQQLPGADNTSSGSSNASGIPWQKAQVIAVALEDPVVQRIRDHSASTRPPVYIKPGDTGVYVNDRGRYAGVYLNGTAVAGYAAPGYGDYMLKVIVDTQTMKEMGVFYGGMPSFMNNWVIIPPENGIYERMSASFYAEYTVPRTNFEDKPIIGSRARSMNLTPADAKLYPLVLDEDNFNRFMNGSTYEVPVLIDPGTGNRVKPDGTMPLIPGWSGEYILPEELQPHNARLGWKAAWYFVVLFNRGSDDVKVKYVSPFPSLLD